MPKETALALLRESRLRREKVGVYLLAKAENVTGNQDGFSPPADAQAAMAKFADSGYDKYVRLTVGFVYGRKSKELTEGPVDYRPPQNERGMSLIKSFGKFDAGGGDDLRRGLQEKFQEVYL